MVQKIVTAKKPKVITKKEEIKKAEEKIEQTKEAQKSEKFLASIGRRKTAVARVRLYTSGSKSFTINEKDISNYLPTEELRDIAKSPLDRMSLLDQFAVSVHIEGGGIHAQAEAIRHGVARGLVMFDSEFKKKLKKAGFLTRDPRMRERKKFGLKRARRAPQWSKR